MANLALDRDGLERLRRYAEITTDGQLAERIGVDPATVSRILSGKCLPGTKFIAGVLAEFGRDCFADIFVIVADDSPRRKMADQTFLNNRRHQFTTAREESTRRQSP
jgi:transcriptional regulator with XRE-family HTH domain